MLYIWLWAERLITQSYDSGKPSGIFLLRVTLASGETLPTRNLPSEALQPKCCLYETPYYVAAPVRETGDVITHLQEPDFFGSRVTRFSGDPSQSSTGSYVLFFKEATCESSTIDRQLYAHETLIVAWRYDVSWDWLWDACHMAGVRWGSRCKGFRSKGGPHYCFMQSARNMTINLIPVGNPLEIPSRAALHSLVGLMSRKEVSVRGFLWVRKVWFAFAQWTFAPETFGERWKLSYFEKPCMLCMKFGGTRTTYYLAVPKVQETEQEFGFPYSQKRAH